MPIQNGSLPNPVFYVNEISNLSADKGRFNASFGRFKIQFLFGHASWAKGSFTTEFVREGIFLLIAILNYLTEYIKIEFFEMKAYFWLQKFQQNNRLD